MMSGLEGRVHSWLMPRWRQRLTVQALRQRGNKNKKNSMAADPSVLYLDVSAISRHDAGTGIQRLVRSVALSLLSAPPSGWTVVPCAAPSSKGYEQISWPKNAELDRPRLPLECHDGVVFLGLDFSLDTLVKHRHQLLKMKRQGVRFWFVMYDLLPHQKPEWFSDKLVLRYKRWLQIISGLADGFFCISPSVAEDMEDYLARHLRLPASLMPRLSVLPMGWDIECAPHSNGLHEHTLSILQSMKSSLTVLMVGTLEPRKGHADVLNAFDYLWQQGHEGRLVIVGRAGWKTEDLQHALRSHPLADQQIFWLNNASDEEVQHLYSACTGVIVASHGEGFGLPLIEALGHEKPVLARDIPVFHTVQSPDISYFNANLPSLDLAAEISNWLSRIKFEKKSPYKLQLPSWGDTAAEIIKNLQNEKHSCQIVNMDLGAKNFEN